MDLCIFLNLVDKFLDTSYINKAIYAKLLTIEANLIDKFTKNLTLVMIYCLYREITPYLSFVNNV